MPTKSKEFRWCALGGLRYWEMVQEMNFKELLEKLKEATPFADRGVPCFNSVAQRCPFFNFFLGKGSPLNSLNQKREPCLFSPWKSTGNLSERRQVSGVIGILGCYFKVPRILSLHGRSTVRQCGCFMSPTWLWVKDWYLKWNPGTWKQGLKPGVPWWFNFDPCPYQ